MALKSKSNNKYKYWIVLFAGLAALVISFLLDKKFIELVSYIQVSHLKEFMYWMSFIWIMAAVFILMFAMVLWNKKRRKYIIPLGASLLLSIGICIALKHLIMRPRPFVGLESLTSYSFPSAHAAAVFSVVAVLSLAYPRLKDIWIRYAILILASRLYLMVHYISDVIAGALLGYFVGLIILVLEEKYNIFTRWLKKTV